ncbi:hypothetical protein ONS95_005088 [Cadophora gregata]|uniref:uncharacterized protein n=1 Tax=Cadophora gregata TaxID=51156 RepID=UPI0026DB4ABB|nr:uncharacterized protein ONS95_005088 [Cadophora gregata]KAK0104820.1 hypothetical protein ONS95_005088 [Cadophora gregata]KAK0115097.1 hypothetical protein ONS96_013567 [Cadophora gregata f. sp. sojae]
MAHATGDTPVSHTLQGLGALTGKQIRCEIIQYGITVDPNDLKSNLLPMLALSRLRMIDKDRAPDPDLLVKVTRWCSLLVPGLTKELKSLGIQKGANKWRDIENLIRADPGLQMIEVNREEV